MKRNSTEPKKVLRFTFGERFVHWVHAIAFLLLLFTGLGIFSATFQPLMNIFGGIQVARIIHRVAAAAFIVLVAIGFCVGDGGRNLREWVKSVLAFDKDDFAHAKNFPIEFFGGHKPFPPQGKFNGGEKLNSAITIVGSIFITISGIIMWASSAAPAGLLRWAYPVHSGFALLMTALLIAHMYLGILHPDSNQAFKGMINGYVPAKFAREHYEKWYEKVKNEPHNR